MTNTRQGTPPGGTKAAMVMFDSNYVSTWKMMNRASAAHLHMLGIHGIQALGLSAKPFCIFDWHFFVVLHGGEEYRRSDMCTLGLLR